MPAEVFLTSGSDGTVVVNFNEDSSPIDLTGYTAAIYDCFKSISERMSVGISDALSGEVTISIEGTDPIPPGRYGFRVQVTSSSGNSIGTQQIFLVVS